MFFWFEISDLVGFSGCYRLTPVTLFIIRSKGSTERQPAVRTFSIQRRFAARKPIESQIFSTRGKLLSSLHRSKRLKATHVAGTFPGAMSKILMSPDTDTATGHGVGTSSLYRTDHTSEQGRL